MYMYSYSHIHISSQLWICVAFIQGSSLLPVQPWPLRIGQVTGALQSADLSRKLILHERQQPSCHVLRRPKLACNPHQTWQIPRQISMSRGFSSATFDPPLWLVAKKCFRDLLVVPDDMAKLYEVQNAHITFHITVKRWSGRLKSSLGIQRSECDYPVITYIAVILPFDPGHFPFPCCPASTSPCWAARCKGISASELFVVRSFTYLRRRRGGSHGGTQDLDFTNGSWRRHATNGSITKSSFQQSNLARANLASGNHLSPKRTQKKNNICPLWHDPIVVPCWAINNCRSRSQTV